MSGRAFEKLVRVLHLHGRVSTPARNVRNDQTLINLAFGTDFEVFRYEESIDNAFYCVKDVTHFVRRVASLLQREVRVT